MLYVGCRSSWPSCLPVFIVSSWYPPLTLQVKLWRSRSSSARTCTSSELVEEKGNRTGSRRSQQEHLLCRKWLLHESSTRISRIMVSKSTEVVRMEDTESLGQLRFRLEDSAVGSIAEEQGIVDRKFYVIRDDLLHPLLGGNKLRKLDALLPELDDCGATDVVTCGGCQSAHTAALAFACAERGMKAHLLLRGERPSIPTGYNLLASMYGHNTYVPRSEYADRSTMLRQHATRVAGQSGSIVWLDELDTGLIVRQHMENKKVIVVKEGAGDAVALLGLIRLVQYLSQPSVFGTDRCLHIVVDTGTGTTAVGLALGILLLELPWEVSGIILAGTVEGYEAHRLQIVSAFCEKYSITIPGMVHLPLLWKTRQKPRKFGNILPGEVQICRSIAQQTGILLDPIYTLAGWEAATKLSLDIVEGECEASCQVVMLHTGGTLGLFGLAQRYPAEFT